MFVAFPIPKSNSNSWFPPESNMTPPCSCCPHIIVIILRGLLLLLLFDWVYFFANHCHINNTLRYTFPSYWVVGCTSQLNEAPYQVKETIHNVLRKNEVCNCAFGKLSMRWNKQLHWAFHVYQYFLNPKHYNASNFLVENKVIDRLYNCIERIVANHDE